MKKLLFLSALALFILTFAACKKSERSSVTGWKYNDQEWGGFEKGTAGEMEIGPGFGPCRRWYFYHGSDRPGCDL
jgi:hypothetical protein